MIPGEPAEGYDSGEGVSGEVFREEEVEPALVLDGGEVIEMGHSGIFS